MGDEIEEVYVTATAFDPEAKEADDFDTANTHLKFKVTATPTPMTPRHQPSPLVCCFYVGFSVKSTGNENYTDRRYACILVIGIAVGIFCWCYKHR